MGVAPLDTGRDKEKFRSVAVVFAPLGTAGKRKDPYNFGTTTGFHHLLAGRVKEKFRSTASGFAPLGAAGKRKDPYNFGAAIRLGKDKGRLRPWELHHLGPAETRKIFDR